MAQVPWEKLAQKPVSEATAGEILSRCLLQLRRCSLYSSSDGAGTDGAWIEQSEVVRQLRSVQASVTRSQRLFSSRKTGGGSESKLRGDEGRRDRADGAGGHAGDLRRSVFHVVRAKGMIQLLPRHLGNVKLGIQLYLLNFLLKYLPEFNGVWLAVDGIRVLQPKSRLGGVLCPLGYMVPDADTGGGVMLFEVELDCLVFKPKTNAMLIGRLQTVRPSHVRLLWLGLFSAVIPRDRLSPSYDIDKEQRKLQHKKGGADIEEGDRVCFQLTSYTQGSRAELLSLEGSLESGYAGLVTDGKRGAGEGREKKSGEKVRDARESRVEPDSKKSEGDGSEKGDAEPKKKRRRQEGGEERESEAAPRESATESKIARSLPEQADSAEDRRTEKKKREEKPDREATADPSRGTEKGLRAAPEKTEERHARTGSKMKARLERREEESEEDIRDVSLEHRKKRRK
ncbi:conserved hypothetical protein [Neospora caninum Liverpool]|uniref:DNA-directed RNA polymerase I RPA43 n=1 Tax=Neospora caninum (strain Liverpool) TaxID=572307 RepID=F0VQB9_NEOCL|nr:conserved hypothetical protein [Neospora caninum Liverpool]CBZ55916.1 conserved hypothetical protein [Neospora caninum Liverpool]CEL70659.1 TPA: DNA-directed RNA polymerase I RPA43 [Neospora caninum Liverpool]|eukprot:XP_003885942.1 conserved hypothetical protein [Neospora caninum Liverpool]